MHQEQTMPADYFFLIEKKWPVNAAAREMERSGTSRAAEGKKNTLKTLVW